MKTKIFTLFLATFLISGIASFAQDNGTGIDWATYEIQPGSPLLLDENFQGFDFFYSKTNSNDGNSAHTLDNDGNVVWGYKELESDVPLINGNGAKAFYSFYQCAFAPEWKSAYGYRDLFNTGTGENSPYVSDGFVEISRFDTVYSAIHTVRGYFQVDLRAIPFVEMIQWTHSSTGGKRRGALCEISLDDGATWDTLRYQPGEAFALSFTKDPFTGEKTPNDYRCEPSGYGMSWVDAIYMENVMLRFSSSGVPTIQTARIHDLKVYGDVPTAVKKIDENAIKVFARDKQILLSQNVDAQVYNLSGVMVRSVSNTNRIAMDDYPAGVYFVKTFNGVKVQTTKLLIK